mmetsp:Transcript_12502/g.31700  ORF Transcript_12502/g.31700 Transcript_12502/m.31700 type:complete len:106 (-) Transcript_12502:293-610(-)
MEAPKEKQTNDAPCCSIGLESAKESEWGCLCFACAEPHCLTKCFVEEKCYPNDSKPHSNKYCTNTCNSYTKRNVVCLCYPFWCIGGCALWVADCLTQCHMDGGDA